MLLHVSAIEFEPSGVITLTTDIGHKGPFVATMKGVMLSRFPAVRIVDLTHETDAHFPSEAGFWLIRAYRYFPRGTVHVAVVDPGVGTRRDIIVVVCDGHAFVAPDNGLLANLAELDHARTFRLDLDEPSRLGLGSISATFHGRDIFAPVAADLASGRRQPQELGPPMDSVVPSWVEEPSITTGAIAGVVVAEDSFGNLITNITAAHLDTFRHPVVRAGGHDFAFHRTYGDVTPGDYVALINSFDALELARAERSAAESLGLNRGARVEVLEATGD